MSELLETPGKEACPGHLVWSAFGAAYPDSVCSSVLDWSECEYTPVATLCDADDDFVPKDVPCPFCDSEGFVEYQFGLSNGETLALWEVDGLPVEPGTEIHFHDSENLWWSATHPVRGEEKVLMRKLNDE